MNTTTVPKRKGRPPKADPMSNKTRQQNFRDRQRAQAHELLKLLMGTP